MELISLPTNIIFSSSLKLDLDQVVAAKPYSKIIVLTDSNTRKHCYHHALFPGPHEVIEIPAGEEHKNLETCTKVWNELTRYKADRKTLLIVLGGGVPGDLGGFCAATYKRGIDFVLIPTTLLSQVDASVGGKLGIDFEQFKNHIGVFQEPVSTIIYTPFLDTLPKEELRSGFAEVIKHCLLSDRIMWDTIRTNSIQNQDWVNLTSHSVHYKAGVVRVDPKEMGLRKVLNFGHTIGHAIESYFLSRSHRLLHGEAIAIGMIAESWIAMKRGLLTESELDEIKKYIIQIFGKVELPPDKTSIISLTAQDKKNEGGKLFISVPKGIGNCIWDVAIQEEEISKGLAYYEE